MPLHLCFDARMANSSGIGTYIRNLIPRLSAYFELSLLIDPQNPFSHPHAIPFTAPIYSIQEQWLYPKVIPPCDIFWSPHYNVPLRNIPAKNRVVTIHDAAHLVYPKTFMHKGYAWSLLYTALMRSDIAFTVSQFSQKELQRFFPNAPLSYPVHVCYDQELFPLHKIALDLEKPPTKEPYFLFVGNLKPTKNIQRLLEAFQILISDGSLPHHLFLVGKQDLRPIHPPHPKIHFLENVPNEQLPSLYQEATALVFPSLYEGFGLPPLEAMAMGCPTIVSKAASLPEVVGNASILIDPQSPLSICSAMRSLASNPSLRHSLQEKGWKRCQEFSWTKTVDSYLSTLQKYFLF